MDCRPLRVDGVSSSSSDDSRETRRSDVVASGVAFFWLLLLRKRVEGKRDQNRGKIVQHILFAHGLAVKRHGPSSEGLPRSSEQQMWLT